MIPAERGFLLLTSHLADPERKPLTVAQFRELTARARQMGVPAVDRDLCEEDLVAMGCGREFARRVLLLLSHEEQLQWYLEKGRSCGCVLVTRLDPVYPGRVRRMLALEAPAVLWAKGELSLLGRPKLSLVGSRDLHPENRRFAEAAGVEAAKRGFCLVSGNARGADSAAQESCLRSGGNVISVVADALSKLPEREGVLYLAEEGYDLPFAPRRAISRNRVIHTLSTKTLIAQCALGKGGTWDGTVKNLKYGWSDVYCFRDGSPACRELSQRGAIPISPGELPNILLTDDPAPNLFNQ